MWKSKRKRNSSLVVRSIEYKRFYCRNRQLVYHDAEGRAYLLAPLCELLSCAMVGRWRIAAEAKPAGCPIGQVGDVFVDRTRTG